MVWNSTIAKGLVTIIAFYSVFKMGLQFIRSFDASLSVKGGVDTN